MKHETSCKPTTNAFEARAASVMKWLEIKKPRRLEAKITTNTKNKILDLSKYNEEEKAVLTILLEKKELEIDQLAILLNISISSLASALLNLEFEGIIKSLPGKKYKLTQ